MRLCNRSRSRLHVFPSSHRERPFRCVRPRHSDRNFRLGLRTAGWIDLRREGCDRYSRLSDRRRQSRLAPHPSARRDDRCCRRRSCWTTGASIVGKTQTDELTYSLNGENIHYGTPINPRAPGRIPGGSSSGSAVAVAGELVDFALGTDCGGSVRAPASFCGIYGMRPSHGRISVAGVFRLAPSFDTVGWFARDAGLLARVGRVLLPASAEPVSLQRLLIANDAFDGVVAKSPKLSKRASPKLLDSSMAAKRSRLQEKNFRIGSMPSERCKARRSGPSTERGFVR